MHNFLNSQCCKFALYGINAIMSCHGDKANLSFSSRPSKPTKKTLTGSRPTAFSFWSWTNCWRKWLFKVLAQPLEPAPRRRKPVRLPVSEPWAHFRLTWLQRPWIGFSVSAGMQESRKHFSLKVGTYSLTRLWCVCLHTSYWERERKTRPHTASTHDIITEISESFAKMCFNINEECHSPTLEMHNPS